MTPAELLALPAVVDVRTAGRAYGLGRELSYELVRRGEFPVPVLHLGRLLRVRRADLLADLGITPDSSEGAAPTTPIALATDPTTAKKQVSDDAA